jgi:hypothetical protein
LITIEHVEDAFTATAPQAMASASSRSRCVPPQLDYIREMAKVPNAITILSASDAHVHKAGATFIVTRPLRRNGHRLARAGIPILRRRHRDRTHGGLDTPDALSSSRQNRPAADALRGPFQRREVLSHRRLLIWRDYSSVRTSPASAAAVRPRNLLMQKWDDRTAREAASLTSLNLQLASRVASGHAAVAAIAVSPAVTAREIATPAIT